MQQQTGRTVQLAAVREVVGPGRWALGELRRVLQSRGWAVRDVTRLEPGPGILVGLAGAPELREALAGVAVPSAAEAVVIRRLNAEQVVVAGSDARGLGYALTEVARAVALAPPSPDPFAGVIETVEAPELAWRSMQVFLCNADLEREWYFRKAFWETYLGDLARARYNNLSLTFAHQTSYLAPPYPFHVALPEFPGVRVPGLSDAERERNLAMLRRISAMACERGVHFTLGVWQQHDCGYGAPMVEGLDETIRAACNALGLRRLLEACPAIDGVQFRMNVEAGVPEDRQLEFWEQQFLAIRDCGRPIRLDLRAKGLADETIRRAREIVPGTVVSTKFWCEHLGLPYGMPAIQSADANNYRRYGTWDLLAKPREGPLIYRLWSAGTQRVLLWGDPEWVGQFARSCRFGGDGFEVMAPLTNKGAGNEPGTWRVIDDAAYQPEADEAQRYWMFTLLFGRLAYASGTTPEVWRRELRARFGAAAAAMERAYHAASGVLPLLTVTQQYSASLWRFWPEMHAGRSLEQDAAIEPSDPTQFYGIAEYVADAMRGELCGKWTPARVAARFRELAEETREALREARAAADEPVSSEFRGTALDFRLLAGLADFHAERITAGVHRAFYTQTREPGRVIAALQHMRRAREEWRALAEAAAGIYHDDLLFGRRGRGDCGHWRDRLPVVDADVQALEALLAEVPAAERREAYTCFPGEAVPDALPTVTCAPIAAATPGQDLSLAITVRSAQPVQRVSCFHRDANQTLSFTRREMLPDGDGRYRVTLPGAAITATWDLMVFFEVMLASGDGVRWPDWREGAPYRVIPTGKD